MKPEIEIQKLKSEFMNLGPMLPGTLAKQWNVCGTTGCRCKDPKRPLRHGPYFQLSFSISGKSSSFFVKKEDLGEVRIRIKRFQRFKKLMNALTQASIQLARQKGFKAVV
jgi:hypothetical protein